MMTQKVKKHRQIPPSVDTSVTITDVPVKISIYHGEKLLNEYADIIDLEFSRELKNGGVLGSWMDELCKQGLSTGDALFTIASEIVEVEAAQNLQSLVDSKLLKNAAGQKLHVKVKRSGDITYRIPVKA
jgi:hypothetical protein